MKRTLPALCLIGTATTLLLSACSPDRQSPPAAPEPTTSTTTPPVADSGLPFDALPDVPEGKGGFVDCPYLDSQWVANTNGQRMVGQGIDSRFDTPACVFWSFPEEPQATVIVRRMPTIAAATAVVDWAAPIDTTEIVEENGWSGGRGNTDAGAVYAVQKDTIAVVVFSNQHQSVKAESIALESIKNLGL